MEYVTSEGIIVTNRIFVGSIPDWMCENKLHLAFQDLDLDVKDTRIVVDMRTGERKGYGFVTFGNSYQAEELVRKGYVVTKDGVRLKVDTAVRKKGLQIRLQRQMKLNSKYSQSQNPVSMFAKNDVYSTQNLSQVQLPAPKFTQNETVYRGNQNSQIQAQPKYILNEGVYPGRQHAGRNPTQNGQVQVQPQMTYVYHAACGCLTSYQPAYQDYNWQGQATNSATTMPYTRC